MKIVVITWVSLIFFSIIVIIITEKLKNRFLD